MSTFTGRKCTLAGTIIATDSVYMAKPESRSLLANLTLWFFLVPLAISVMMAAMVISFSFSMLSSGRSNRPGFLSNIASQMTSFFLMGKVFGPKEQVPVRDIRLRDRLGREHLVRVRGELVAGSINVGDEIELEGLDRHGTILLERGWNKRIRTEIKVRRR